MLLLALIVVIGRATVGGGEPSHNLHQLIPSSKILASSSQYYSRTHNELTQASDKIDGPAFVPQPQAILRPQIQVVPHNFIVQRQLYPVYPQLPVIQQQSFVNTEPLVQNSFPVAPVGSNILHNTLSGAPVLPAGQVFTQLQPAPESVTQINKPVLPQNRAEKTPVQMSLPASPSFAQNFLNNPQFVQQNEAQAKPISQTPVISTNAITPEVQSGVDPHQSTPPAFLPPHVVDQISKEPKNPTPRRNQPTSINDILNQQTNEVASPSKLIGFSSPLPLQPQAAILATSVDGKQFLIPITLNQSINPNLMKQIQKELDTNEIAGNKKNDNVRNIKNLDGNFNKNDIINPKELAALPLDNVKHPWSQIETSSDNGASPLEIMRPPPVDKAYISGLNNHQPVSYRESNRVIYKYSRPKIELLELRKVRDNQFATVSNHLKASLRSPGYVKKFIY